MFTKDKPELGREPDLGRRGSVSGALKRYFKITDNYKNMTMAWGQYGKTGGDSKIDGIKIDRVLDPPKWRHAKTR